MQVTSKNVQVTPRRRFPLALEGLGWYFLPQWAAELLSWRGFQWGIPLLLVLYLAVNRRRGALGQFGRVTAWAAAALAAAYGVSLAAGGGLARYLNGELSLLFSVGYYDGLFHWATGYLTLACAAVALYEAWDSMARLQAEAGVLRQARAVAQKYHSALEISWEGGVFTVQTALKL